MASDGSQTLQKKSARRPRTCAVCVCVCCCWSQDKKLCVPPAMEIFRSSVVIIRKPVTHFFGREIVPLSSPSLSLSLPLSGSLPGSLPLSHLFPAKHSCMGTCVFTVRAENSHPPSDERCGCAGLGRISHTSHCVTAPPAGGAPCSSPAQRKQKKNHNTNINQKLQPGTGPGLMYVTGTN